jgi:hypothetical protein
MQVIGKTAYMPALFCRKTVIPAAAAAAHTLATTANCRVVRAQSSSIKHLNKAMHAHTLYMHAYITHK